MNFPSPLDPYGERVCFTADWTIESIADVIHTHAFCARPDGLAFMVQLRAELDRHIRNHVAAQELSR